MRHKGIRYVARSDGIKQFMRVRLKAHGCRRPTATLRARRMITGLVGRGDWFNVMLDLNRDLESGELKDVLDYYGEYIVHGQSVNRCDK